MYCLDITFCGRVCMINVKEPQSFHRFLTGRTFFAREKLIFLKKSSRLQLTSSLTFVVFKQKQFEFTNKM